MGGYVVCDDGGENDGWGECNWCKMMEDVGDGEMDFGFGVVGKKGGREVVWDELVGEWGEMVGGNWYGEVEEWMGVIDGGNEEGEIYVGESDEMEGKVWVKGSEGG